jgi:uncharacterized membrane protein YedE/YeeE
MPEPTAASLVPPVLWAAFALAFLFGAIAQRTHFCTMGSVSDIVNVGDWTRARMWILAVAVAILGFNAMVGLGWVEAKNSFYAGPRVLWLSALVGGLMFGFGMVLSSGCGSRTLIHLGTGNLKSLIVLLVLGISALVTLRGLTGVIRAATVDKVAIDLQPGQDLPSLVAAGTGWPLPMTALAIGAAVSALLIAWVVSRREGRSADVWLGGVGVGAVIVGVWWVSGQLGYLPEDPATLEPAFVATNSRRMESLSMVAPVGYALDWLMWFSDASKTLTIGIVAVAGIVLGSCASALATRSFRWQGFRKTEDLVNHVAGGVLMGVGGVLALGCTIGQGLSGLSTLSLGSVLAVASIVGGALLALRYQEWRFEKAG